MSLEIKDPRAIVIINKFFQDNITSDDFQDFPELVSNDLVCSLIPGDRSNYKGKRSATMTTDIVKSIVKFFKEKIAADQKKFARFNKPEVCFFAYVLQQLYDEGNLSYYSKVNFDNLNDGLCKQLVTPICTHDFDAFLKVLSENNVKLPKNEASKRVEMIKHILEKSYADNSNEWNTVRIVELFHVYDEIFGEYEPSVLTSKVTSKVVFENLAEFLKYKNILTVQTNAQNIKTIVINTFNKYHPSKCTFIDHDQPDMEYNASFAKLFRDYTLDQVDEFINLRNGYCVPIDYLAIKILTSKGRITIQNTSITFSDYEIDDITRGIYIHCKNNKYFRSDLIAALISNYTREDILSFYDQSTNFEHIIRDATGNLEAERGKIQNSTLTEADIEAIFSSLLSGKFLKRQLQDNVKSLYYFSSNTIFELIGLLGYTYFSDMLTRMSNNGESFKISNHCTDKIISFYDRLKEIHIDKTYKTLHDVVKDIKFGGEGIDDILAKLGQICIHGVGKMCLQYYLRCYDTFLEHISSLLNECFDAASSTNKLYPLPKDRCEEIQHYFKLAPFVMKTSDTLERKTGIRYLTCLADDDDVSKHNNPYKHSFVISGFTSDLTEFYHLCRVQEHSMANKFGNMVEMLMIDKTRMKYSIRAYEDNYFDRKLDIKRNQVALYLNDENNEKEFLQLLRIPYIFQKNRIQRFDAYCDFTLSMCEMMTTNLDIDNSKINALENVAQNAKSRMKKYSNLAKYAKKDVFDVIMFMEVSQIPKHMILIQFDNSTVRKHMNADFNALTNFDFEQDDVKNKYYATSLENLVAFPYSITYDDQRNLRATILTPDTRKDITNVYQHYQLISEVLYTNAFEKILVPFNKYFQYFENYFLSVVSQPMQLQLILFDSKIRHTPRNTTITKNYANLNLINAPDYSSSVHDEIGEIMQLFVLMTIAYLYFIMPFNDDYYNYIKQHLLLTAPTLDSIDLYTLVNICNSSSYSLLKKSYTFCLHDIITATCGEGTFECLYKYHFTELDKEVYLLKELNDKIKIKHPLDDSQYIWMIEVLNQTMYIYKDNPLSAGKDDALYTNESKAIALEYITKLELMNAHATRMNYFRNMFEVSIKNFMNLSEDNFNANISDDSIYLSLSSIARANLYLKNVFKTYVNEVNTNSTADVALSNASHKLADLFNILPTLDDQAP